MRNPQHETLKFLQNHRHPGLEPGPMVPRAILHRHAGPVPASTVPLAQRCQAKRPGEIVPAGIVVPDRIFFPVTPPLLDALFGSDRRFHGFRNLVPNQARNAVPLRESLEPAIPMLHDATSQIRRHRYVKRAVETARENVDARYDFAHAAECAARWMPEHVRHDVPAGAS